MKYHIKHQKGFTLVELMIVIAILGILAAIAIPNFLSYREKSKIAQAESELKGLETTIMDLALDTNMWPTGNPAGDSSNGGEVWNLNAADAGLVANGGGWDGWVGPYLTSVPTDPWGKNYFMDEDYMIDGVNYTVIGSFGPNKVGPNVYDDDDIIILLQETN